MRSNKAIKYLFSPAVLSIAVFAIAAGGLRAQPIIENPREYEGMGIQEHLGERIPLDMVFHNESGESVQLSDFFGQGKPVILTLVYYNCPMLCNLILNGLTDGLTGVEWNPGDEYQIVTVSFNPLETPELAVAKKRNYLSSYGRPGVGDGWAFLTGEEDQIQRLADAVGFEFYWVEERQEYAHPSCIFVLTEDGTISRYLYGIDFQSRDLRLALVEASEGKVGSTIDRLLLYCFHYDPDARGYVAVAGNIMKLGGAVTLLVLGVFLGAMWSRERFWRSRRVDTEEVDAAARNRAGVSQ